MDKDLEALQKEIDKLAKAKKISRAITVKKCGMPTNERPKNFKVVRLTNFLDIDVGSYLDKADLESLISQGITVNVSQNS